MINQDEIRQLLVMSLSSMIKLKTLAREIEWKKK